VAAGFCCQASRPLQALFVRGLTLLPQMALTSSWCKFRHTGSQSTSASASPLSGHRLWADISDGEDDSISEWGEDRMLPSTFDIVSEPETPQSSTPQELEDVPAELQASTTVLNVYAPEFLPTLSMNVALVGIYDVILEGDEAQGSGEEALHAERHNEVRFVPSHCLKPLQSWQSSSKGSKAGSRYNDKFWKKPMPLREEVRQPRVPQCVPSTESLSEEQLARRIRSIQIGMETKEYLFHLEKIRSGRPGAEPLTPDPQDASIGRRQWNHVVQNWRDELSRLYLLETEGLSLENRPEAASVASTEAEEAMASEMDDSTTVSDDASSSQWS